MSARRPGAPPAAAAAALVALLGIAGGFALLAGCGRESPTRGERPVALAVSVRFATVGRAALGAPAEGGSAAALESIRARALEVMADGSEQTRATAQAAVAATDSTFSLSLSVPPAPAYRVIVEAIGTGQTQAGATGFGTLYAGSASVSDLASGATDSLSVLLRYIVPAPVISEDPPISYRLFWDPVPDATSYRIRETSAAGDTTEFEAACCGSTFVYPPARSGGRRGEALTYQVGASLPADVVGALSPGVELLVPGPLEPSAVTDLRVSGVTVESALVEWTAPGDDGGVGRASEYDVRYDTMEITEQSFVSATRFTMVNAPLAAGEPESLTITGLSSATTYFFALRSADDVPLWSALSNVVSARTLPLPPDPPSALVATPAGPEMIRLDWQDGSDNEDSYEIERLGPDDRAFSPLATITGAFAGAVAYTDVGLSAGTTYRYRVRAANAGGVSAYSNEAAATTSPAAACDLSATLLDFGTVSPGASTTLPFTIRASGGPIDGDVSLACGGFSIVSGAGAFSLAAGETLEVVVRYEPTGTGVDSCVVSVGGICPDVLCVGETPMSCPITLSTDSLAFGELQLGQFAEQGLTVVNQSAGMVSGNVPTACGAFVVVQNAGSYSLAPMEQLAITVRYEPVQAGVDTCTLFVTDDPLCEAVAGVACIGTGVEPPPLCAVSVDTLPMGEVAVGDSIDMSFTVRNVGGSVLSGSADAFGCTHFSIVAGGGGFDLSAGDSLVVTVRYEPSQAGAHECSVSLGSGCPGVVVIGSTPAVCSVDVSSLLFPPVPPGQATSLPFTIKNIGGSSLNGLVPPGCLDFAVSVGEGPYSLAPGEVHDVVVDFQPMAPGLQSCTIPLGPSCPAINFSGSSLDCLIEPDVIDFGVVPLFSAVEVPVRITNVSQNTLVGEILENCLEFSVVGADTLFTLVPGQFKDIVIEFFPVVSSGPFTCEFSFSVPGCGTIFCTGVATPR